MSDIRPHIIVREYGKLLSVRISIPLGKYEDTYIESKLTPSNLFGIIAEAIRVTNKMVKNANDGSDWSRVKIMLKDLLDET